jgi:hypothetical protein
VTENVTDWPTSRSVVEAMSEGAPIDTETTRDIEPEVTVIPLESVTVTVIV